MSLSLFSIQFLVMVSKLHNRITQAKLLKKDEAEKVLNVT